MTLFPCNPPDHGRVLREPVRIPCANCNALREVLDDRVAAIKVGRVYRICAEFGAAKKQRPSIGVDDTKICDPPQRNCLDPETTDLQHINEVADKAEYIEQDKLQQHKVTMIS